MLRNHHILYNVAALALAAVSALMQSCIHNDIPFPRIAQNILAIAAQGESSPAVIDPENLTVTITLDETTDPSKVCFTQYEITPGAESSLNLLEGTYDLTSPLKVTLSRYQDYQWIITANYEIERIFSIEGQVGQTTIDAIGHRIVVYIPSNIDITHLKVSDIKLGPAGITEMSPDLTGQYVDFSRPVHIDVTYFGQTTDWTVYVDITQAIVTTDRVDAWSNVVWAYGSAPADADNGFQYREAGTDDWLTVPAADIIKNEGSFHCKISHLKPLTEYEVRATSDSHIGNVVKATTQATMILPDGSFDQWWLNGRIWCPWDENGVQFWDTGNTGASTLGQSNVTPTDNTPNGTGKAASLETRFVGIGSLGKLAAGSIYTGKFAKVDGTNGILDFGRPWTVRPTKLKGYYMYKTAPINYASTEYKDLIGRPDTCHIYIAITDWTAPYQIRTNPKNRQLFDKNSPAIIAYGELLYSGTMSKYEPFEITLQYRSTSRVPSYILVAAAASKYGDFFTGGAGALLLVDQFSLSYDY